MLHRAHEVAQGERFLLLTQLLCRREQGGAHQLDVARRGVAREAVGDRNAVDQDGVRSRTEGCDERGGGVLAYSRQVRLPVVATAAQKGHGGENEHKMAAHADDRKPVRNLRVRGFSRFDGEVASRNPLQTLETPESRVDRVVSSHGGNGIPTKGNARMKPVLTLIDMTAIAQTTATAPAAPPAQRADRIRFCTRCGTVTDEPEAQLLAYGFDRVCDDCGMGVLLTGPRKAINSEHAAFVVVSRDGRITAVSEAAENLLGDEPTLLDTPLTSSITSPAGDEQFVRAISRAAGGGREVTELRIVAAAPAARRLGPLRARIASCGPPRAALLVLERAPL